MKAGHQAGDVVFEDIVNVGTQGSWINWRKPWKGQLIEVQTEQSSVPHFISSRKIPKGVRRYPNRYLVRLTYKDKGGYIAAEVKIVKKRKKK